MNLLVSRDFVSNIQDCNDKLKRDMNEKLTTMKKTLKIKNNASLRDETSSTRFVAAMGRGTPNQVRSDMNQVRSDMNQVRSDTMIKNTMKIYILLGLLAANLSAFSQCITYTYDDAGNRIQQNPISCRLANPNTGTTTTEKKVIKNAIEITPNPTEDLSVVRMINPFEDEKATLTVTDITGRQLIHKAMSRQTDQVNLAKYAPGVYFIRIETDEAVYEEKLLKK